MIKEVLIAIVLSNIIVVIYCGIMALTIFMSINKLHKKIDQLMALITLNKEMPKEVKETTLIHEWLHAVLDCIGCGDYTNDEKLVCGLQNELYRAGFRVKKI